MAWTPVTDGSDGGVNGASVTLDTTGCDFLWAVKSWYTGASEPPFTDSKNASGWTWLTAYFTGNVVVRVGYLRGGSVGTGHNFALSESASFCSLDVFALSGAVAGDPYDTGSDEGATGSGTSIQPGSKTPSEDNCLVVTAVTVDGGTLTLPSGYSGTIRDYAGGSHMGSAAGQKIQTTAAAENPAWSNSSSVTWAVALAVFKAAAGGGTTTSPGTVQSVASVLGPSVLLTSSQSVVQSTASVPVPVQDLTGAQGQVTATAGVNASATLLNNQPAMVTVTDSILAPATLLLTQPGVVQVTDSVLTPTVSTGGGGITEAATTVSSVTSVLTPTTALTNTPPEPQTSGAVNQSTPKLVSSPGMVASNDTVQTVNLVLLASVTPPQTADQIFQPSTALVHGPAELQTLDVVLTPTVNRSVIVSPVPVSSSVSVNQATTTIDAAVASVIVQDTVLVVFVIGGIQPPGDEGEFFVKPVYYATRLYTKPVAYSHRVFWSDPTVPAPTETLYLTTKENKTFACSFANEGSVIAGETLSNPQVFVDPPGPVLGTPEVLDADFIDSDKRKVKAGKGVKFRVQNAPVGTYTLTCRASTPSDPALEWCATLKVDLSKGS